MATSTESPGALHMTSATYWETRARRYASQGDGLAAICSYGMPAFYNRAIDWTQRHALKPFLENLPAGQRVLDVGCGVGRWSLELARQGHRVTGLDLSPTMVDRARVEAARVAATCEFMVGDVTALPVAGQFDLILSVTVIQHVLADSKARAAIAALGQLLSPTGSMILLEVAPAGSSRRCNTAVFTARHAEWYQAAIADAGLELVDIGGVDPAPFKLWLLPYYRKLPRLLAIPLLALATAFALPVDLLVPRRLQSDSWHKVMLIRRARIGTEGSVS